MLVDLLTLHSRVDPRTGTIDQPSIKRARTSTSTVLATTAGRNSRNCKWLCTCLTVWPPTHRGRQHHKPACLRSRWLRQDPSLAALPEVGMTVAVLESAMGAGRVEAYDYAGRGRWEPHYA